MVWRSVLRIRSGIRCFFDPWILDPGWLKSQDPDPGSGCGMNNPDHISKSLETIFWVKILKFFDAEPRSGMEKIRIRGSGINIPDPATPLEMSLNCRLRLINRRRSGYVFIPKISPLN
jgi:hypothetical protein